MDHPLKVDRPLKVDHPLFDRENHPYGQFAVPENLCSIHNENLSKVAFGHSNASVKISSKSIEK